MLHQQSASCTGLQDHGRRRSCHLTRASLIEIRGWRAAGLMAKFLAQQAKSVLSMPARRRIQSEASGAARKENLLWRRRRRCRRDRSWRRRRRCRRDRSWRRRRGCCRDRSWRRRRRCCRDRSWRRRRRCCRDRSWCRRRRCCRGRSSARRCLKDNEC